MMEITVVMATRNSAIFLEEALRSIVLQRNNELNEKLRLIVIDADSKDGTKEIVNRVSFANLQQQKGNGLWQAWNQAIEQVETPWIAMLDSDDYWEPSALANHVKALQSSPSACVSIGLTRFILATDHLPKGIRSSLFEGFHRGAIPGATIFHKDAFLKLGLFNTDYSTASDVDWFLRLYQSNLIIAKPEEIVLNKRIHSTNLSLDLSSKTQYDQDLLSIARNSMRKKRLQL